MMTSSNGNIFRVTGPLCGEFTSHQWIPLTKASDAELWCFLWSSPEQTIEWITETLVIWDAIVPIMTFHLLRPSSQDSLLWWLSYKVFANCGWFELQFLKYFKWEENVITEMWRFVYCQSVVFFHGVSCSWVSQRARNCITMTSQWVS